MTGQRGDYDLGDMDEQYLDSKDENAFEPLGLFARKYPAVAHVTYRILFDLRALKSAAVIGERVPQGAPGHHGKQELRSADRGLANPGVGHV
jgi:hypothetical protein